MNNKIANWDALTDDQKKNAEALLKGNPGLNTATVHPAAKFFEEHHWVKIDKFIDRNMANLLYHHVQLNAARLNYLDESLGRGKYDEEFSKLNNCFYYYYSFNPTSYIRLRECLFK